MKVLLIGNYLPDAQHSMTRYVDWLAEALVTAGIEATILRPQASMLCVALGSESLKKWLAYADKFVLFPFVLRKASKAGRFSPCL